MDLPDFPFDIDAVRLNFASSSNWMTCELCVSCLLASRHSPLRFLAGAEKMGKRAANSRRGTTTGCGKSWKAIVREYGCESGGPDQSSNSPCKACRISLIKVRSPSLLPPLLHPSLLQIMFVSDPPTQTL